MSIAIRCPDCCTCPPATVELDSRNAFVTKNGFFREFVGYSINYCTGVLTRVINNVPLKYFRIKTHSGTLSEGDCSIDNYGYNEIDQVGLQSVSKIFVTRGDVYCLYWPTGESDSEYLVAPGREGYGGCFTTDKISPTVGRLIASPLIGLNGGVVTMEVAETA